jgi:DNA-binding CsgD family transcriptional regulator
MKNAVIVSALLAFQLLCYSMFEIKNPGFESLFWAVNAVYGLAFAAGLSLYGLLGKGLTQLYTNRYFTLLLCLIGCVGGILSLTSRGALYLACTVAAALINGFIAGHAYYALYALIPKNQRGRTLAGGIISATLIHYFIEFSRNTDVNLFLGVFFSAFILSYGALFMLLPRIKTGFAEVYEPASAPKSTKSLLTVLVLASAVLSLMSSIYEGLMVLKQSGVQSPLEILILRNTKFVYCLSLLAAGLIADLKGRRLLSALTAAAMVLIIINAFLIDYDYIKYLNWVILFISAGFMTLFVTLSFTDTAQLSRRPGLWAGGGRIIRHSAAAAGSLGSSLIYLNYNPSPVIFLVFYLGLLIILIFLLLRHYRLTYELEEPIVPDAGPSPPVSALSEYELTDRERQIYELILTGRQIKDLASELYITERTVKFHIGNILKKTGAKNQRELLLRKQQSSLR